MSDLQGSRRGSVADGSRCSADTQRGAAANNEVGAVFMSPPTSLLDAALDLVSAARRVRAKFGTDDYGNPLDWTEWLDVSEACDAIDRIAASAPRLANKEPGDEPTMSHCEIEEMVIQSIRDRRDAGRAKYGTTMERTDLSIMEWLQHAQEEALDHAIYLERIKQDVHVLATAIYAADQLLDAVLSLETMTCSQIEAAEHKLAAAKAVLRGDGTVQIQPPQDRALAEIAQLRRDIDWLRLRIGPMEGDS